MSSVLVCIFIETIMLNWRTREEEKRDSTEFSFSLYLKNFSKYKVEIYYALRLDISYLCVHIYYYYNIIKAKFITYSLFEYIYILFCFYFNSV